MAEVANQGILGSQARILLRLAHFLDRVIHVTMPAYQAVEQFKLWR
ncbi:MAG: hypothetical protein KA997_03820 [Moraxellaceae bacterium]|nr:hypothetical protein [Moraxellaceae bacterium]MBP7229550.1 hypothetical protein [Moraxellaceae bacterium]